jgi:predicted Zn-dependent protease
VIAKGVIKRVSSPGDLDKKVESVTDTEKAAIYAEAGIWYDALEAISNAVDAHPEDASLREQRASLLKQVGLPEAAAIDRGSKGR